MELSTILAQATLAAPIKESYHVHRPYCRYPQRRKIPISLEELQLDYRIRRVDLNAGEQKSPDFERLNPNGKIPVLVDESSGVSLFESCAILFHLANATGRLMPAEDHRRDTVLQWLFLQAASVEPMLGQLWWFRHAALEPNGAALDRYLRETRRIYGVVDRRLAASRHVAADEYTVADIACYPWLVTYDELGIDIGEYPAVREWLRRVGGRPAVQRGLDVARATHV
jgi:GSH-dependent disulfide-bond oxidoreductase